MAYDFKIAAATGQDPEVIIYQGTKESLLSVPLESLRDKAESLGINIPVFPKYFYEDDKPYLTTGNWRGYVATWQIENDTLFLAKISDWASDKTANLSEIFGGYVTNERVMAFWYTGDLCIPKGDLVYYVDMGLMSIYEREIIIDVENGVVIDIEERKNESYYPPSGFQRIATNYIMVNVPESLTHCSEPFRGTICLKDDKGAFSVMGFAINEMKTRLDRKSQREYVSKGIDSCMQAMSANIKFGAPTFEKQRFGYVGWVDGTAKGDSDLFRILVMSNFYSRLYIQITQNMLDHERFNRICEVFSHSMVLTEFGH